MHGFQLLLLQALGGFVDHHQSLLAVGRDGGRNHPTADGELFDPRCRHGFTPSGGNDGGIRCPFGVTQHPVANNKCKFGSRNGRRLSRALSCKPRNRSML